MNLYLALIDFYKFILSFLLLLLLLLTFNYFLFFLSNFFSISDVSGLVVYGGECFDLLRVSLLVNIPRDVFRCPLLIKVSYILIFF